MALLKECHPQNLVKAMCMSCHNVNAAGKERTKLWVICSIFILGGVLMLMHGRKSSFAHTEASDSDAFKASVAVNYTYGQNLLVEGPNSYVSTISNFVQHHILGDLPCYAETTKTTKLEGLPEPIVNHYYFQTNMLYHLTLVAYREDGMPRCSGGDYFEVDFYGPGSNSTYKARLPLVDHGNGTYGLELMVPSHFAGPYTLDIYLLFSNWHGLDALAMQRPDYKEDPQRVIRQELHMGVGRDPAMKGKHPVFTNLTRCSKADFGRSTWQGRWTRSWFNDSCEPDDQKRFHCLSEEHSDCEEPWCFGRVGRLESNGWGYSAHCSFKIFESQEAWNCLKGRWILSWGDSSAQDTFRNLLLFVMDWPPPKHENLSEFEFAQTYETAFINPQRGDQVFQVSQIFNGYRHDSQVSEGMKTLLDSEHQAQILAHFKGKRRPDTIIMNSAIHDAFAHRSLEEYSSIADFTVLWWMKLYASIPAGRKPKVIWRNQLVPGGKSGRRGAANAHNMEIFNLIFLEKLQKVRSEFPVDIIDGFDLSFPWHYTDDYSDGAHYGRPPGANVPPWFGKPHWYFVDVMLANIFLNVACPFPGG